MELDKPPPVDVGPTRRSIEFAEEEVAKPSRRSIEFAVDEDRDTLSSQALWVKAQAAQQLLSLSKSVSVQRKKPEKRQSSTWGGTDRFEGYSKAWTHAVVKQQLDDEKLLPVGLVQARARRDRVASSSRLLPARTGGLKLWW